MKFILVEFEDPGGTLTHNTEEFISLQAELLNPLKGQDHGKYHDFGQKFTKFKL